MPYEVIKAFRDKDNEKHYYRKGDAYPVKGYEPSDARIKELASDKNATKTQLIKEVGTSDEEDTQSTETNTDNTDNTDNTYPKHTGSGWYELSNGEKVQGKDAAIQAENELT